MFSTIFWSKIEFYRGPPCSEDREFDELDGNSPGTEDKDLSTIWLIIRIIGDYYQRIFAGHTIIQKMFLIAIIYFLVVISIFTSSFIAKRVLIFGEYQFSKYNSELDGEEFDMLYKDDYEERLFYGRF